MTAYRDYQLLTNTFQGLAKLAERAEDARYLPRNTLNMEEFAFGVNQLIADAIRTNFHGFARLATGDADKSLRQRAVMYVIDHGVADRDAGFIIKSSAISALQDIHGKGAAGIADTAGLFTQEGLDRIAKAELAGVDSQGQFLFKHHANLMADLAGKHRPYKNLRGSSPKAA